MPSWPILCLVLTVILSQKENKKSKVFQNFSTKSEVFQHSLMIIICSN